MSKIRIRYIVDDVDSAVAFYTAHLGFEVGMRPAPGEGPIRIRDRDEIAEAGWFLPAALPEPLQPFFANLIEGRHLPLDADHPFRGGG